MAKLGIDMHGLLWYNFSMKEKGMEEEKITFYKANEILKRNPFKLDRFDPKDFTDTEYKELVKLAVKKNPLAFEQAPLYLKDDVEFVKDLLLTDTSAISYKFVSDRLKCDPMIVISIYKRHRTHRMLRFVSYEIKNSKTFFMTLENVDKCAINYVWKYASDFLKFDMEGTRNCDSSSLDSEFEKVYNRYDIDRALKLNLINGENEQKKLNETDRALSKQREYNIALIRSLSLDSYEEKVDNIMGKMRDYEKKDFRFFLGIIGFNAPIALNISQCVKMEEAYQSVITSNKRGFINREMLAYFVGKRKAFMKYMPEELMSNVTFAKFIISQNGDALKVFDKSIRNNLEIANMALATSSNDIFDYVGEDVQKNKKFVVGLINKMTSDEENLGKLFTLYVKLDKDLKEDSTIKTLVCGNDQLLDNENCMTKKLKKEGN